MSSVKIHSSAVVDLGAQIGKGTSIWHFCHVMEGAVIGEDCKLGQNVHVASGVRVGSRVKIQNNVSLYTGVEIDDEVFLGPSCVFTNVINPRSGVNRKDKFSKTHVKTGATIGANATIVCGITIGEYAFIGAGAVVTHAVKPFALMTGVPATQKGWMSRYGYKLPEPVGNGDLICPGSGAIYSLDGAAKKHLIEKSPGKLKLNAESSSDPSPVDYR